MGKMNYEKQEIEALKKALKTFEDIGNVDVEKTKNTIVIKIALKKDFVNQKESIAIFLDTIIKRSAISKEIEAAGAETYSDGVFIYYKYKNSDRAEKIYNKFVEALK